MLKITSFSALIIGLLLAAPLVFSDAEAGRMDTTGVAPKSDRESVDRQLDNSLIAAFRLVDICSRDATGDAASWCAARNAELSGAANEKTAFNRTIVESRDEAARTTTLATIPADAR